MMVYNECGGYMKILCPAKINLFLNVLGKEDKMHTLFLINQTVDLFDEIELEITKDGNIKIVSEDDIPLDETNSIYKAALLFKETYNIKDGFVFYVKKRIPMMSGLGGESTDAAGTLHLLNEYYNLGIDKNELADLGLNIGSDVPFFVHSGFKIVKSTGGVIEEVPFDNPFNHYIIIKPEFGLSTKEMYHKIDSEPFEVIDSSRMPYNDFMKVVPDSILDIKNHLDSLDLENHTLSGSGSAYYIPLKSVDKHLLKELKEKYHDCFVTMLSNTEGYIIEGNNVRRIYNNDNYKRYVKSPRRD